MDQIYLQSTFNEISCTPRPSIGPACVSFIRFVAVMKYVPASDRPKLVMAGGCTVVVTLESRPSFLHLYRSGEGLDENGKVTLAELDSNTVIAVDIRGGGGSITRCTAIAKRAKTYTLLSFLTFYYSPFYDTKSWH